MFSTINMHLNGRGKYNIICESEWPWKTEKNISYSVSRASASAINHNACAVAHLNTLLWFRKCDMILPQIGLTARITTRSPTLWQLFDGLWQRRSIITRASETVRLLNIVTDLLQSLEDYERPSICTDASDKVLLYCEILFYNYPTTIKMTTWLSLVLVMKTKK